MDSNTIQKFRVLDQKVHTMAHLPQEILREIFKDCKIKEILNYGLVCQSWNNFVELPEFMDRVRIGGNGTMEPNRKIFLDYITKSERNYMHLKIDSSEYLLGQIISLNKFNWKTITLYNLRIERNTIKTLQELAPSLEAVRMFHEEEMTSHHLFSLMYPIIQLECRNNFRSVVTLMNNFHANAMTGVRELLIDASCFEIMFKSWNFICPLKKFLLLNRIYKEGSNEEFTKLISIFLTHNQDSLQEISIEYLERKQLELIFKMKHLKKLAIGTCAKFSTKYLDLNVNTNITMLGTNQPYSKRFYSKLFNAAPNIEKLFLYSLNHPILEMAVLKLPELSFIQSVIVVADIPHENIKLKKLKTIKFQYFSHAVNDKFTELFNTMTRKEQNKWMLESLT